MNNFLLKKWGLVLTFLLFITSLSSCGKKSSQSLNDISDNEVTVDMNTTVSTVDYIESLNGAYLSEEIARDFTDGFCISANLESSLTDNDSLGIVSYGYQDGNYVLIFSSLNNKGVIDNCYLDLPKSDDYISDEEKALMDKETSAQLNVSYNYSNFYIGDSDIFGIVNIYYYCFAGDTGEYCYSYDSILCRWSTAGELLFSENLTEKDAQQSLIIRNSFGLRDKYVLVISDDDGYSIVSLSTSSYSYTTDKISSDSDLLFIDDIVCFNSNEYVAFYKDDAGITKAAYFDSDKLVLSSEFSIPDYITLNGYSDVNVSGNDDVIFSNYIGVYSYNLNDGSFTEIMDYVNSDFEGYFVGEIYFINDQEFYGVYTSMNDGQEGVYYFSPDSGRAEDKAITVLGSYKLSAKTRKQLLSYNTSDNLYRVVIKDYSVYDTLSEPELGYELLESDILNDGGLDFAVVDLSKIDINKLADNNKLVSWNYMAGMDTNFSSAAYLTNVLDAYAVNGYDYVLVYDFIYRTYLGNAEVIGNSNSFSVKTFKKNVLNDSDVILYSNITQEDYIENLITYDAADYIDTAENISNFNCDDFITLLKYANTLPIENDEITSADELYRNGGLIIKEENIIAADGFWEDAYRYFDGNAVLAGFPGEGVSNSIVEYVDFPFLIMSEGNISGAWDVVKSFYSLEYQSTISNAIPVNSNAFDDWGNETLYYSHFSSYGASGESDYLKKTYYYDGQEYEIPYIEEDNISKIKETIKSTKKSAFSNEVIYNIILEESYEYLNGNQTAKKAASNMDDRITKVLQGS